MNTHFASQIRSTLGLISRPPGQVEHPGSQRRWGSLPMVEFDGKPEEVLEKFPVFERAAPESLGLGCNPNFDLVVRKQGPDCPAPVPVGMVSKAYRIVQHRDILTKVCGYAEKVSNSKPDKVEVSMTENGERVMFRVDLGEDWRFSPDGKQVGLQVVCRNSVDGSSALRLQLGWFRFVCSNGMIVGVTLGKVRMTHVESADMDRAFAPLQQQLEFAQRERENLTRWGQTSVTLPAIRRWVDTKVLEKWNSLSAARVWSICHQGLDAKFIPPFEKALPSERKVKALDEAPGAPKFARTLYDAAQALSYVASRRTDVDDADSHQREIGPLIGMLQNEMRN